MPDTIERIAAQTSDAWPETDPSLLEEGRPALPDFPLQSLPPWWRAWVGETAHGAGAPVDYIAQACWRRSPASAARASWRASPRRGTSP